MFDFFEDLIEKLGIKSISDFTNKLYDWIKNIKNNSKGENNDNGFNSARIVSSGNSARIGSLGGFAKEEIEVGDYIRTENGEIRKIVNINKTEQTENNPVEILLCDLDRPIVIFKETSKTTIYTLEKSYAEKLKHSKQQIELIEDKDIVEIELSEEFVEKKDKKKLIQIGDIYTKEILQKDIDNGIITRILTILSYNQYMANCYKVGGEDE